MDDHPVAQSSGIFYGDGGIKRCETTTRKRHGRADYAALSDWRCDRCAYVTRAAARDLIPFRFNALSQPIARRSPP